MVLWEVRRAFLCRISRRRLLVLRAADFFISIFCFPFKWIHPMSTPDPNDSTRSPDVPQASPCEKLSRGKIILFTLVFIFGLISDLTTKQLIFVHLGMPGENPPEWIIPNVFGFQTSLNQGALFGVGQNMTWLFIVFSFLVPIWIFWVIRKELCRSWWMTAAYAAILAGVMGNLYDRLALHHLRYPLELAPEYSHLAGAKIHAVRDWILVMIGNYPWPNFNIADVLLVTGVSSILIYCFFLQRLESKKEKSSESRKSSQFGLK